MSLRNINEMKFTIDEQYLTCVTYTHTWNKYNNIEQEDLTPDQLIDILNGIHEYSQTETIDHPEFTKLRELLGDQGYIKIERNWWNGDIVLKPFFLNGLKFKKGVTFPSASALYTTLFVSRRKKINKEF